MDKRTGKPGDTVKVFCIRTVTDREGKTSTVMDTREVVLGKQATVQMVGPTLEDGSRELRIKPSAASHGWHFEGDDPLDPTRRLP